MARLSYLRYLSGLGNSTGLGNSLGNQRPAQGGGAGSEANNSAGSSKKSSYQSRSKTSNFAPKSFIRKRKRGNENVETSQTPGGTSTLSLDTDPISDTFLVGLMNIKKLDEIKWMNLLEYTSAKTSVQAHTVFFNMFCLFSRCLILLQHAVFYP